MDQLIREPGNSGQGSLAETAYVLIRQQIEAGEIGPGLLLKEADVASSLGMGRTPVREGLQRLRVEGLLAHTSKGYLVHELSVRDILNVFQVRGMLEAAAARQAARSKTRVDIARMLDALDLERSALDSGDPFLAASHGESFHELVVDASKNPFLAGTLQSVRLLTVTYLKRVVARPGLAQQCFDGRQRIFQAIDDGDPEISETVTRDHIRTVMWTVLENAKHE